MFKPFIYIIFIFIITDIKNNFCKIFEDIMDSPTITDYSWMAVEVTDLLKLIHKFNYFKENNTNKMKHLMFKIQMCKFLNFLDDKLVGYIFYLDSINI